MRSGRFYRGRPCAGVSPHAAASAGAKTIPKTATWEHGPGRGTSATRTSSLPAPARSRTKFAPALRNIPRDEHDAAVAVLVRPGCELDRRMGEVLHLSAPPPGPRQPATLRMPLTRNRSGPRRRSASPWRARKRASRAACRCSMTKLAMPSLCAASATKPERSPAAGSMTRCGSSAPLTAMSMVARGLRLCRRCVSRSTVAGVGEIGLRDHEAVGEDHLLARLGGAVERGFAVDRVDHGQHHLDVKFAAERAVGGEGLQDRAGIGETAGLDHDAAERRHRAALAIDHQAAQRVLQVGAGVAAEAAVAEQQVSSALSRTSASSMPTAPNSLTMTAVPCPSGVARKRRTSVVLPAPRKPVTIVTGIRAPRSRFCRRPNGPASREGKEVEHAPTAMTSADQKSISRM